MFEFEFWFANQKPHIAKLYNLPLILKIGKDNEKKINV